ncbi:MAG TPA: GNAT family N-acetyltransferase [Patescibacteria group bacterium]|nr:GNAT family N-acetyltransferase [Patescibacteria group bacterium]
MGAVSQALAEFANHVRPPAAPGVEVIRTERYQITLVPDFPIPGPNSVSHVRCAATEVDGLIAEVRGIVAPRRLPLMWVLDPETEPADMPARLAAHGAHPDPTAPEVAVMALPIAAVVDAPSIPGLEIHDALADLATFRLADAVGAEAFGSRPFGEGPGDVAAQERRRINQLAAGTRRLLLATVGGEPAGSAGMTLFVPDGAIINGGGVRERFRGLGVYRALVAARLELAREAGVAGLTVWGNLQSGPILSRLGFVTVGRRRFFVDTTTA